jgi:hypothetical protein
MFHLRRCLSTFVLLCTAIGLFSFAANAQGVEVFGGYTLTHLAPNFNGSGWNAAITKNFKHVLGVTGDFSGTYSGGNSAYTYTAGPVVTARLPAVQPFAHVLFGGISNQFNNTGFIMLVGGGLDIGLRNGIGFRIIQADWMHTDVNSLSRNRNVRGSTGIVWKF